MTEVQEIGIGYIKTIPGIIKIVQEVLNFIGMICIVSSVNTSKGQAFLACSIIGLIVTGILLLCYITQIVANISVPWYKIEFFYCIGMIIFYIIVSAIAFTIPLSGYIAAGVFGIFTVLAYGADAYLKFRTAGEE